jgi:hypothetical protein
LWERLWKKKYSSHISAVKCIRFQAPTDGMLLCTIAIFFRNMPFGNCEVEKKPTYGYIRGNNSLPSKPLVTPSKWLISRRKCSFLLTLKIGKFLIQIVRFSLYT